jgi:hypothetical protein
MGVVLAGLLLVGAAGWVSAEPAYDEDVCPVDVEHGDGLHWLYESARCLDDGRGVEVDQPEAVRRMRSAAEAGHAPAQHALGTFYRFGEGTDQNLQQAVQWHQAAADRGYAPAMNVLALLKLEGVGVERDPEAALKLLVQAARVGDSDAAANLVALVDDLPTATIRASRVRIRQQPSEEAQVLGSLHRGNKVAPLAERGEWLEIYVADEGLFGFVHRDFLDAGS